MIDAHCHVWRLGCNDCTWPPPALAAIHRDWLLDDWQDDAAPLAVERAIVVQSQPSARDTAWLLALARDDARVAGVVGWVDFAAADAPSRIAALALHPKLRGLRPMLHDLPADDWITSPALAPATRAMITHGLCFDALVRPRHLPHLLRFAERNPQLTIVIDHAAKPDVAGAAREPWRGWMARLAALPQVYCKLSGLVTEAGPGWREADLRPCVEHLLDVFGPQRLLWGSDWPVVNLAADYARWFHVADALTGLTGVQRAALFGGTAARVYGIERGGEAT